MARTTTPAAEKQKVQSGNGAAEKRSYHHGSLKEGLLRAAEEILATEGIAALTLREAARRAGVSHAAPKNHFKDASALMSELAAVGFRRLAKRMSNAVSEATDTNSAMDAIARAYVGFARTSPGLFNLMYRSEALDPEHPVLREATGEVGDVLKGAVVSRNTAHEAGGTALDTVASMAASWCLVHGFATLLIDHRLNPLLAYVPGDRKADVLLDAVLARIKPGKKP